DRAAPMVTEGPDVPFFNGNEPSQFTSGAVEMCRQFESCRNTTVRFVERMTDLDLWDTRTVSITPNNEDGSPGDPVQIADFFAVSEDKLLQLPADKFVQLRDEGWVVPIYAHLCSQLLWPKILNRTLAVSAAQQNVPLN